MYLDLDHHPANDSLHHHQFILIKYEAPASESNGVLQRMFGLCLILELVKHMKDGCNVQECRNYAQ